MVQYEYREKKWTDILHGKFSHVSEQLRDNEDRCVFFLITAHTASIDTLKDVF
jgi:hypothetical protein